MGGSWPRMGICRGTKQDKVGQGSAGQTSQRGWGRWVYQSPSVPCGLVRHPTCPPLSGALPQFPWAATALSTLGDQGHPGPRILAPEHNRWGTVHIGWGMHPWGWGCRLWSHRDLSLAKVQLVEAVRSWGSGPLSVAAAHHVPAWPGLPSQSWLAHRSPRRHGGGRGGQGHEHPTPRWAAAKSRGARRP